MARHSRTWQDFTLEALGTLASTVLALVVGLVGAVVLAWATGSLFRIVLAPGSTDVRAALTAVAALFVVGAGLFLGIAILQKVADIHHRHRARELQRQGSATVPPPADTTTTSAPASESTADR